MYEFDWRIQVLLLLPLLEGLDLARRWARNDAATGSNSVCGLAFKALKNPATVAYKEGKIYLLHACQF